MTRSYKMLVLLAMLNEDRFPGEIKVEELGEAVLTLASRNHRLREDLGPSAENPEALKAHLEMGNALALLLDGRSWPLL